MSHYTSRGILVLALGLIVFLSAAYQYRQNNLAIATSNTVGDRELPIYCVDTEEKKVALSFDAAWGDEDTMKILSILEEEDVTVTFFMTGGWVESYPDDVKAIYAAGHDLGNHSEHHYDMATISSAEQKEELMTVHDRVKELTGYDMYLFRPPYGSYNNDLVNTAISCGYYPIQWNVDSLDWKDYGVDSIISTVCEHKDLKNGSIILMHNGATYTAEALKTVIETLRADGYELVPISELIYKDNYHLDVTGMQISDSGSSAAEKENAGENPGSSERMLPDDAANNA